MIKETKEGFKILVGVDGFEQFQIDSSRLNDCISYIINNNVKMIGINSYLGYCASDIDFLDSLKDVIEGITIPDNKFDIEIINSLHNLKFLGYADNKKNVVNLSNFPKLETLACEYSVRLKGLETCNSLKYLTLTNFKAVSKDLSALPELVHLRDLSLFISDIHSLNGIEKYLKLKKLSLFKIPKLEFLSNIQYLYKTIECLEIEKCKHIKDMEIIGSLVNLKNIKLTDCGDIKSIEFIESLPLLSILSFAGTQVLDGDLSYCERIPHVGFDNKKHYTHRFNISSRTVEKC